MAISTTVILGSKEYLYVDVTADHVLDMAVEMAVTVGHPVDTDWQQAAWVGDVTQTRSARILLDGTLAAGVYTVWARLTDNPEVPILDAGRIKIA